MIRIAIVGQNHPMLHELMRRGTFALLGSTCYSGQIKRGERDIEVEIICIECSQSIGAINPDWVVKNADWQSQRRRLSVRPPRKDKPGTIRVKSDNKAARLAASQLLAIISPTQRKQLFGRSLRRYRHTVLSPG